MWTPSFESCSINADLSKQLSLDTNWFIAADKLDMLKSVGFPARAWRE
jgi:hypothetical protein